MRLAARSQDLQRALLQHSPAIVHFSGHGNESGELLLENSVSRICRQHPLLLVEAAQFLQNNQWKMDAQTFQDVMSGKYAMSLDAPTQQDLIRTVPDADTRELLYRLRLVAGPFSDAEVRELGSVPQPIEHVGERLIGLLGLPCAK